MSQKLYQDKLGEGLIEVLKDSGPIEPSSLNQAKVHTCSPMLGERKRGRERERWSASIEEGVHRADELW